MCDLSRCKVIFLAGLRGMGIFEEIQRYEIHIINLYTHE